MKKTEGKKARQKQISMVFVLLLACVLTGCRPPAYTREHKKAIAKAHAQEAREWFKENMPDVKISRKAQAYADGRDLFMIIEGKYREGRETYSYRYDYEHDRMYLSKDYDKMVEFVKEGVAKELGSDAGRLDLLLTEPSITTHVENDVEDFDIESRTSPAEFLPADMSPEEFAGQVLRGEMELFFFVTVYEETIRPYDKTLFEKLPNAASVSFQPPMEWGSSGQCEAHYEIDAIEATYLCTQDAGSDVYAGYLKVFRAELDENGQIIKPRIDPMLLSGGYEAADVVITDRTDDTFTLQIPPGACPVVFVPKGYDKVGKQADEDKMISYLDDMGKSKIDVFGKGAYEDFYNCILPASNRTMFKNTSTVGNTDGTYHIVLEKNEK
ncbi:MAG: hypothetical protein K5739_05210 [Lachnospiraceae bacterium]|nr:hypothetical protein [Lachnospiraceae bacterium]